MFKLVSKGQFNFIIKISTKLHYNFDNNKKMNESNIGVQMVQIELFD